MRKRLLAGIARLLGTMLIAGLLGATLVRFAPGFGYDPTAFDPRLSEESRAAIRQQHESEKNILTFYANYLTSAVRGDWGTSISLNLPVRDLVRDRLAITLKSVAYATTIAWFLAIVLAAMVELTGWKTLSVFSTLGNAGLLSAPAAVLALLCL